MSMFCYQCQEAAKNKGCTVAGVCGKSASTANLQDLLVDSLRGVECLLVVRLRGGPIILLGVERSQVVERAGQCPLIVQFAGQCQCRFSVAGLHVHVGAIVDMEQRNADGDTPLLIAILLASALFLFASSARPAQ